MGLCLEVDYEQLDRNKQQWK